ncbi:MAG TPA: hypothetical protein VI489_03545 [Candidatus Brocadiaceae bacterium]
MTLLLPKHYGIEGRSETLRPGIDATTRDATTIDRLSQPRRFGFISQID